MIKEVYGPAIFRSVSKNKIIAIVFTVTILSLLILSGPAEAYTLGLSASKTTVTQGEKINFDASLTIDNGEIFDIDYLILKLSSPNNVTTISCKFFTNGTIISGCPGITIAQVSSAPYGYSYGYNYGYQTGKLGYNITLNTSSYLTGKYHTFLDFVVENQTFQKEGTTITIKEKSSGGSKTITNACYLTPGDPILNKNIRGRNGEVNANGTIFSDKLQLKLTLPSKTAKNGQGSITVQSGRNRFSYSFKVTDVVDSANKADIYVSGNYRIGTNKAVQLTEVITLDKVSGKASMHSDGIILSNVDLVYNGNGC